MAQTRDGAIKIAAKKAGLTEDEYRARADAGLKRCTLCKEWKSVAENFGNDSTRHDRHAAKCFGCTRVKVRKDTKGRPSAFKGRMHTAETRRLIAEKVKEAQPAPAMLGKKHSLDSRKQISETKRERGSAVSGARHHAYKDGKVAERRGLRFCAEYKRWRFDVFLRDKFTCQKCGDNRGGNLRAHHIKPFADFPELRFDVGNGITLCDTCHDRTHYGT